MCSLPNQDAVEYEVTETQLEPSSYAQYVCVCVCVCVYVCVCMCVCTMCGCVCIKFV